jgi:N-acetylglutamate synthase-like GNAT family acetyltransferase
LDVVLNPLNPEKTKTQLMQMAVETNQQRKGIGKLLVEELLSFCKSNGIKEKYVMREIMLFPFI